jgi:hypothetical protein
VGGRGLRGQSEEGMIVVDGDMFEFGVLGVGNM